MTTSETALTVREATVDDAVEVAELLAELGYPADAATVRQRLERLLPGGQDPVFLAVQDGRAVGLVAMHFAEMVLYAEPVARITTLVVREGQRGTGVGKRLIEQADRVARARDCHELELTTGVRRTQAQAFYEARGFGRSIKYSIKYHAPAGGPAAP